MNNIISEAVIILNQGGIIIFPTDTAFGIGCRMDNEEAIRKLFTLRRRPETQATPVLFDSLDQVKNYVTQIPAKVEKELIDRYWPGALTIILPSQTEKVPSLVRGGTETIGTRIPNNQTAQTLIKGIGVPLLGPSANFHGGKTPYTFEDLDPELCSLVDYVVPGECILKQASTVIDCTIPEWKIVRQGAVQVSI